VQATVSEETYRRLLQQAIDAERNLNEVAGDRIEETFNHE